MKIKSLKLVMIAFVTCFSMNVVAQTAGTLTFKFTEATQSITYGSNNQHTLVVWIESCPTCIDETTHLSSSTKVTSGATHKGTLYSTHLRYCCNGSTTDHIPQWRKLNGSTTATLATGGTSSSTLSSFTTRTVTWSPGTTVPDGSYRICVEECWDHGTTGIEQRYFSFTKGVSGFVLTPADDAALKTISLTWTSTLANDTFVPNENMASVYPNPSNGVFNIDFKSEVKNIKVLTVLGQIVYDEEIPLNSSETSKKVDLSNLTDGEYIIILSNDLGSSSYKVVLQK